MKTEYKNKVMDTEKAETKTSGEPHFFPEYGVTVIAETAEEALKIIKDRKIKRI